jgi:thymidine phosphorylase
VIHAAELIRRKRDGERLSSDELSELVLAYARGEVPDYQMAAFCMAVYFRGLNGQETFALTDAMIRSGETIELGPVHRFVPIREFAFARGAGALACK